MNKKCFLVVYFFCLYLLANAQTYKLDIRYTFEFISSNDSLPSIDYCYQNRTINTYYLQAISNGYPIWQSPNDHPAT